MKVRRLKNILSRIALGFVTAFILLVLFLTFVDDPLGATIFYIILVVVLYFLYWTFLFDNYNGPDDDDERSPAEPFLILYKYFRWLAGEPWEDSD
jgi:hypothetical protein